MIPERLEVLEDVAHLVILLERSWKEVFLRCLESLHFLLPHQILILIYMLTKELKTVGEERDHGAGE